MKNIKRWVVIFRTLSNVNRVKIINILLDGRRINVGDIAKTLGISIKATSNHLAILKNLDILESQGKSGHVFYSINPKIPQDFQDVINLI